MSINNQIIIISLCFFLSLLYIRGFLYGVKRYQLNNSAYKKRKKGENFKEWMFYSRYKEEIPKTFRILYYAVLIIHPTGMIACLLVYIFGLSANAGETFAIFIAGFDVVWILVLALLFWSSGRDYAYERWITKKRGQNRKKK